MQSDSEDGAVVSAECECLLTAVSYDHTQWSVSARRRWRRVDDRHRRLPCRDPPSLSRIIRPAVSLGQILGAS